MEFQRSQSGKAAKGFFVRTALIYVEGEDDTAFFSSLRSRLNVKFEPAGGKPAARELAEKVLIENLPYIIVLDGDFDYLLNRQLKHPRIIYLDCYSIECLFCERSVLSRAVEDYSGTGKADLHSWGLFEEFARKNNVFVWRLVMLDLYGHKNGGQTICPARCDVFLTGSNGFQLRMEFSNQLAAAFEQLPKVAKDELQRILSVCENSYFLLRGHIVFGLLRRAFREGVKAAIGRRPQMEDRALLRLFSEAFWAVEPTTSSTLVGRLKEALADLRNC